MEVFGTENVSTVVIIQIVFLLFKDKNLIENNFIV